LLSVDWNRDLIDDAAYFGVVGGDAQAPTGRMMRRHYTGSYSGSHTTLLNTDQAFVTAPLPLIDSDNRRWLFFGSGRLFSREDLSSSVQQSFYGVKELGLSYENLSNNTFATSSLINTTGIRVHHTTDVRNATIDGSVITVFDELEEVMKTKDGWRFNFDFDGSTPSTRNLFQATPFVATILFPVYTPPNGGSCEIGSSDIYQLYTKTGTAPAFGATYATQQSSDGKIFSNDGIVSKVNLLNHAEALGTIDNRIHYEGRVTSKTSTGEWIVGDVLTLGERLTSRLDGRNSWRQIFNWEE
jgi:Tfp pilus tip-associated adhesin PilY1